MANAGHRSEPVGSVRQARATIDAELAAQQRVTVALWQTTRLAMPEGSAAPLGRA